MNEATVFIVDDNPNNLALLAGILREAGYQVRAANDGVQALVAIGARARPRHAGHSDARDRWLRGLPATESRPGHT
jgi:CheY-like chemotaxis protein